MSHIERNIPYEDLGKLNQSFFEEYKEAFDGFLTSGWYVLGEGVRTFESNFAEYCGSAHFSGLASGLDALTIALKVFGFKPGSEVIVPSNTYIATILAIVNNGLKPILVEPNITTYNIDVNKIEASVSRNTVAIMPVHLYGKCSNMKAIMDLAKLYNLKVIEDAAQAHGARFEENRAGSFGDFGAFSFYPTKNLGALGDGGGLTTDDRELNARVQQIRNYGSTKKYYNEELGFNSRLDEIQANFLDVKLKSLDQINEHKRKLAQIYLDALSPEFIVPEVAEDYFDVYHIFNIRTPRRDELKEYLFNHGIKTEIHYPVPPHQQKALRNLVGGDYPIADKIHSTTLSLPISYCHNVEDIEYVTDVINNFGQ